MFPFPSSLTFKNLLEMGGMESIVHEFQADVFIMQYQAHSLTSIAGRTAWGFHIFLTPTTCKLETDNHNAT